MDKLPKITRLCRAPNLPEQVELDLEWEGDYKTMLTFHVSDFDNDGANARKIIEAHVGMVKRKIDSDTTMFALRGYIEEIKRRIELEKLKCQQELENKPTS